MSQSSENQETLANYTVVSVKMRDPITGAVERCHYGPQSSESKNKILQICRDDAKKCFEEQNNTLKDLLNEKNELEKKIAKVREQLVRFNRQNRNMTHSLNQQAEEQ